MAWPPDVSVPRTLLVALGAVLVLAVVVAASTSASAFGLYNPGWEGTSDLRALAGDAGATYRVAESTTAYTDADATATTAIVLAPAEPYTAPEVDRLQSFLADGGTLLVAGDVGAVPNQLLADLGADARLDGDLLRDERYNYRGPALPVADAVTATPVTEGVDRLTLNHATPVVPNGATVLVGTSPYAYVDRNGNQRPDDTELLQSWPVATRERVGAGTLYVVGDPSVFINRMLEAPDNRVWTRNLLTGAETVLLDTSHAAPVPPLAGIVLALRESILLQLLGALVGVGVVGAVTHDGVRARVADWWGDDPSPAVSAATVERLVVAQHPDWDRDRVQRVVEGVMNQRRGGDDDD